MAVSTYISDSGLSLSTGSFNDADDLTRVIGWESDFRQLQAGPLVAEIQALATAHCAVMHTSFNRRLHQIGAPPGDMLTFGILESDRVSFTVSGKDIPRHSLLFLSGSSGVEGVSNSGFRAYPVSISRTHAQAMAERLELSLDGAIADLSIPGTQAPGHIHQLRRRLGMLFRSSLTSPLFLDDLDARDLLEFEIPAAILRACANVESRAPRPRVRARDRALRKALELIGDPHAEPVRLEKLSRAVNVSWRTLDYAFREHYGMTPKSYLTAVRLNKARKDLLAAEPGETVEGIAARWGFFHPSRFAARYREQFGELPSQTIG